ncbi:MAG: helix-turn-helix transcriptional regulator [Pseudomonadota bacterium]
MSNAKRTAATANLRLVCTLGLPSELLAPAIADALQALIGFSNLGIQWLRTDGSLEKIWFDQKLSPLIVREYTDHFIDTREMACKGGIPCLSRISGARLLPDWGDAFYRTDYYEAIWRPLGFHIGIVGAVRTPFDALNRGLFSLYRMPGELPFQQSDAERLTLALPYLAHAFSTGSEDPGTFTDTGEEGVLVVDRGGAIQMATPCATDLLFYGSGANLAGCTLTPQHMAMELVRRIVCCLEASPAALPPPVLYIDNAFGRFTFRAHWFGERQDLVGITARREEPVLLRLVRASRHLRLSPTQKHILVFAALQQSNTDISRRMRIKPDTVKGHMAIILERLGIHDRNKIGDAVLRPSPAATTVAAAHRF